MRHASAHHVREDPGQYEVCATPGDSHLGQNTAVENAHFPLELSTVAAVQQIPSSHDIAEEQQGLGNDAAGSE